MFEFNDPYLKRGTRNHEALAKRIALMLYGEDTVFFEQSGTEAKYTIGRHDDYWLFLYQDGQYRFVVRYGTAEKDAALRFMFASFLNVEVVPQPKQGVS